MNDSSLQHENVINGRIDSKCNDLHITHSIVSKCICKGIMLVEIIESIIEKLANEIDIK